MDIDDMTTRPRDSEGVPGEASAVATVGHKSGTVADSILAFATGGTAGCTSGRAMARLYLLLTDGAALPIRETDWGLDGTRRAWWEAAMMAFSRGAWDGTRDGVDRVRAKHPYLARQIDAASAAYEAENRAIHRENMKAEDDD
ncbi:MULTISPECIES: hypothetical protein [unclassified Aureimonas]|uniref:hypothetical protein n=1 Tax=unclassified Aureimonas TaxID=2615206 RepID=UPI0006F740DC|nr:MULTISPECIES: hypothetical protein [unclassified Aureimonas]KQT64152.1 hypothetical protein ASG62_03915 [Aureimonas sp. Leaf427]KQT81341.1 hypothetical protein ASG54_01185 [Aureimonas sp. Leaf460]